MIGRVNGDRIQIHARLGIERRRDSRSTIGNAIVGIVWEFK